MFASVRSVNPCCARQICLVSRLERSAVGVPLKRMSILSTLKLWWRRSRALWGLLALYKQRQSHHHRRASQCWPDHPEDRQHGQRQVCSRTAAYGKQFKPDALNRRCYRGAALESVGYFAISHLGNYTRCSRLSEPVVSPERVIFVRFRLSQQLVVSILIFVRATNGAFSHRRRTRKEAGAPQRCRDMRVRSCARSGAQMVLPRSNPNFITQTLRASRSLRTRWYPLSLGAGKPAHGIRGKTCGNP